MQDLERQFKKGVYLTLTYDGTKERESELHKLVWRSLMALGILLIFVWLAKREWNSASPTTRHRPPPSSSRFSSG